MSKRGTVLSSRVGNAYVYQFNREHLAFPHVMGLADLSGEFLRRHQARLSGWAVPTVYAAVFGSAARGTMTIDILLVRPDDAVGEVWDEQVAELMAEVTRWTGNDARDLQFTESEIAGRAADAPVLRDVMTEALTVAGSRAGFTRLLRRANRQWGGHGRVTRRSAGWAVRESCPSSGPSAS
ncbi:nucleotidyltransferase domain-containing protein [Rhodococcus sp. IEGM 1351]|uniref:nucleotidyltransferase domain-containing protein n=1 Tax=Rhodococcus sp. IEGM 1351 TaxID=3047089 RepID=UPI0024B7E4FE|nr:nucleotidyltransferase domain-containing protein [Rhodococcus sp. IEGM 1351]MDI9939221.1 nucleotidyltransferase domain-containing protein [Rhodococcus sp. IEGM 1351]